ncbi:MAG: hypothetical protein AB7V18_13130 [Pyrinomonadaceae bacterium]
MTRVPETDLILLSRDLGSKSRLEAVDLIAAVLVRGARGASGREFKGKPIVHVLRL